MEYTKENPLRCFFAFEGYNSQGLALNRLKQYYTDFDYVCVGRSEIDKYAIQAADVLFPEAKDKNYGNISRIDWAKVPDFDLFTMSSPCQDFSSAGLQKGGAEGSGTRSSLLWECRRAILTKKPKYILFENVKALVSKKFLLYFNKWQAELASYGYRNFAKVLNTKDYGVPQNRERIFMVSILGDAERFYFPEPFPLERRLKDVLEKEVDEKYYLSQKIVDYIFSNGGKDGSIKGAIGVHDMNDEVANTITAQYWKTPRQGNYLKVPIAYDMKGHKVYGSKHVNNLVKNTGGNFEPKIIIGSAQKNAYIGSVEGVSPCINAACGMGGGQTPMILGITVNPNRVREYGDGKIHDDVSMCITSQEAKNTSFVYQNDFRIRKLTPRECFRLQGVDDADIDKIQAAGISRSQQYKMAGNSITVDVLFHIFRKLFIEKENENKQLTLF